MASQTGQQIITTHILPNIFRSKGNPVSQWNKTRKVFLLKSHTQNVLEKLGPERFIRNKN